MKYTWNFTALINFSLCKCQFLKEKKPITFFKPKTYLNTVYYAINAYRCVQKYFVYRFVIKSISKNARESAVYNESPSNRVGRRSVYDVWKKTANIRVRSRVCVPYWTERGTIEKREEKSVCCRPFYFVCANPFRGSRVPSRRVFDTRRRAVYMHED